MATLTHHGAPTGLPSAALLESAIRHLSRDQLAGLCEQLIDRLDILDAPAEELEPEDDYCTAGDDRGSNDLWGTGGMSEDDEMPWQPPTLGAA